MQQAGNDMRVNFNMELYDDSESNANTGAAMAAGIKAAIGAEDPPEAIVVNIPSEAVKAAVMEAVSLDIPVFGMYSGYEYAEDIGMQGFVAMDQELAGEVAGNEFLKMKEKSSDGKVAYLTLQETNDIYGKRLAGLKKVFSTVEEIQAGPLDPAALDGCPYDYVLLASSDLLADVLQAYEENGCDYADHPIGTFDTNSDVHDALSSGKLAFTVSQQQHLQGALSLVMATLYATTGKALATSSESEYGMQSVGPTIITPANLPSDTDQECENDSFPVCPNTLALGSNAESTCPCTDRKKIKIAGVTHGVTTDEFWDVVYKSAGHAADDFGVELQFDRFEPEENSTVLHEKMAGQIESLCKEGVDGIFVTIPNDIVLDEIEFCTSLNIPVISINAGPDYSEDLGLYHHIAMDEFQAGVQAGKRMVATGKVKKALCLMHAPNNVVLTDRCGGFKSGILGADPNIEYLGDIDVPEDNDIQFRSIVEDYIKENVDDAGDWDGIGILLAGQSQIEAGLPLKDDHSSVLLGAFDTNDALYDALDEGKILFGIDQGPYLQGYMPIPLLTWQVYTNQWLSNHEVASGPEFVVKAPSDKEAACQVQHFPVCPRSTETDTTAYAATTESTSNKGAIIAVSVIVAVLVLMVAFLTYRVYKLNKHLRKTRDDGQEVPQLSIGSYVSSVYQGPEEVIRRASASVASSKPDIA
jgi:simple sugar transport system substrate-binding protein